MLNLYVYVWSVSLLGCRHVGRYYHEGQTFNLGCKECICDWGKVSCDDTNCGGKHGLFPVFLTQLLLSFAFKVQVFVVFTCNEVALLTYAQSNFSSNTDAFSKKRNHIF